VVDNVASGLWSKSVVERNGEKRLGHGGQIGNLPFGAIVAPQANAVFLIRYTSIFMELDKTSAEILASLLDGLIILPNVWTVSFGLGVPVATTKAFVLGNSIGCGLEEFMGSANLYVHRSMGARRLACCWKSYIGVKRFHEFVCKSPVPVHWRPAWLLRAWYNDAERLPFLRRRLQGRRLLDGVRLELYHDNGVE